MMKLTMLTLKNKIVDFDDQNDLAEYLNSEKID